MSHWILSLRALSFWSPFSVLRQLWPADPLCIRYWGFRHDVLNHWAFRPFMPKYLCWCKGPKPHWIEKCIKIHVGRGIWHWLWLERRRKEVKTLVSFYSAYLIQSSKLYHVVIKPCHGLLCCSLQEMKKGERGGRREPTVCLIVLGAARCQKCMGTCNKIYVAVSV